MPYDTASYILGQRAAGGGGSSVTVEALDVTENGEYTAETDKAYSPVNVAVPQTTVEPLSATENKTYTAPSGKAYSPVTVNVPNSYSAGDEGKVVSNGALVAQTSDTVTANDTYDTTLINSLTVSVSGGGAPQPYQTITVATPMQDDSTGSFKKVNELLGFPLVADTDYIYVGVVENNADTSSYSLYFIVTLPNRSGTSEITTVLRGSAGSSASSATSNNATYMAYMAVGTTISCYKIPT